MSRKKFIRMIAVGLLTASTVMIASGCGIGGVPKVEYEKVKNYLEEFKEDIDESKYTDFVKFIFSNEVYDKEKLEEKLKEYDNIISDKLKIYLRTVVDGRQDEIESIKELGGWDALFYEDKKWTQEEWDSVTDEEGYPIYGSHMDIIDYGTKEESIESEKAFREEEEVSYIDHEEFQDLIVYTLDDKYYGPFTCEVYLEDGKIVSADIEVSKGEG